MLKLAEGGGQWQPGQSLQGGDARGQPLDNLQEVLDKRIDLLNRAKFSLKCLRHRNKTTMAHVKFAVML